MSYDDRHKASRLAKPFFRVDEEFPCPRCGRTTHLWGMYFMANDGSHMHTYYKCLFWPKGSYTPSDTYIPSERCGWEGWTVRPEVGAGVDDDDG